MNQSEQELDFTILKLRKRIQILDGDDENMVPQKRFVPQKIIHLNLES